MNDDERRHYAYLRAVLLRAQSLDPNLVARCEAEVKVEQLTEHTTNLERQIETLEQIVASDASRSGGDAPADSPT